MGKVSKSMKELWKIKKQINKEISGKSWEEIDQYFKETSERFYEDMRTVELQKVRERQKVQEAYMEGNTTLSGVP